MQYLPVMRRGGLALLVVITLVAGVVILARRISRDDEWAHGGDSLQATVQVAFTDSVGVTETVKRLGGPGDVRLPDYGQVVVVQLNWSGPDHPDGWYELVLLDGRERPAPALQPVGGWHAGEGTGSNWAGAYEVLPEHYPYLAGVASKRTPQGSYVNDTMAVDAPADGDGSLTAVFLPRGGRSFERATDLIAAVFLVNSDGEVRWARRLTPSG